MSDELTFAPAMDGYSDDLGALLAQQGFHVGEYTTDSPDVSALTPDLGESLKDQGVGTGEYTTDSPDLSALSDTGSGDTEDVKTPENITIGPELQRIIDGTANRGLLQTIADEKTAAQPIGSQQQTGVNPNATTGIKAATTPPINDAGSGNNSDILNLLKDKIGDKGIAALITGGFGLLSGVGQSQMLQKSWENQKKMRDEEWARKDTQSYAGGLKPMTFTNKRGLLGESVK